MPRVSDYVPQIIEYIAQIETNGLAYESAGSVYFDTTAFECANSPPVPILALFNGHSTCTLPVHTLWRVGRQPRAGGRNLP